MIELKLEYNKLQIYICIDRYETNERTSSLFSDRPTVSRYIENT